jgi:cell division septation protein DedD
MDDEFNVEEFRRAVYPPETVLTMGPMLLLGISFGLVLLCGLCFGVGYSVGSHGAHASLGTVQQPVARAASQAAASLPKPSAAPHNISQPQTAAATAPATVPALALMVQIAIVSHQEDADVLVRALRKRGYVVSVSRDAADNQYHVRVGPFANRNDANAMRKKLIYDGYNAIVQP